MQQKTPSGFTLIELLVVIAIIGLIASVILVSVETARARARDAERMTEMRQVVNALSLFAAQNNGQFPAHSALPNAACGGTTFCLASITSALQPTLPVAPSDPRFGNSDLNYKYCATAGNTQYTLLVRQEKTGGTTGEWCVVRSNFNVTGTGCYMTSGSPTSPFTWCQ